VIQRRAAIYAGLVVGLAFWWFYVIDWIARPGYRISIIYTSIVLVAAVLHARALLRFHRMVRHIKIEERLGETKPGSTLFAVNQRFRYLVRIIESAVVMIIGILGLLSVHNPHIILSHNYIRLIITYFVGSVAATGYLTLRDLQVINQIRRLNTTETDSAILSTGRSLGEEEQ
jgi:hypothetical protein